MDNLVTSFFTFAAKNTNKQPSPTVKPITIDKYDVFVFVCRYLYVVDACVNCLRSLFGTVNFPGGSEVKCVDGSHIIRGNNEASNKAIQFDISKDVFVCAEQCIAVLASLSPVLEQNISIDFVSNNSAGVYQYINLFNADNALIGEYMFVPLSLLMGVILLFIHQLDIPLRLRLYSFIGNMHTQCVRNYPAVGRVQVVNNGNDSAHGSPRVETSRFHELGITVEEFEECQKAKYIDCYRVMRGYVPPNIARTSLKAMIAEGLPPAIANRVWSKRVLWLITMHPSDLPKVFHITMNRHDALFLIRLYTYTDTYGRFALPVFVSWSRYHGVASRVALSASMDW
jgi:hypothetical protein